MKAKIADIFKVGHLLWQVGGVAQGRTEQGLVALPGKEAKWKGPFSEEGALTVLCVPKPVPSSCITDSAHFYGFL